MSKPSKVIAEKCANFKGEETSREILEKDVITYALGVGCSRDPLNKTELDYTYELSENFQVLPTMGNFHYKN